MVFLDSYIPDLPRATQICLSLCSVSKRAKGRGGSSKDADEVRFELMGYSLSGASVHHLTNLKTLTCLAGAQSIGVGEHSSIRSSRQNVGRSRLFEHVAVPARLRGLRQSDGT